MSGGDRRTLIDAVTAALPILSADRDVLVESNTLNDADGEPDIATLDGDAKEAYAEYSRAIELCNTALRKAGLR